MTKTQMKNRKNVYEIITEKITEQLKKGVIPWRKPWSADDMPRNYVTEKAYRGINPFYLNTFGYSSPYWLSFKQCTDNGGKVKKGEKGAVVVYWRILENKTGERNSKGLEIVKKVPLLRYYTVFNFEQCEGLKSIEKAKREFTPIKRADNLVQGYKDKPVIRHENSRAFYSPSKDSIGMPKKESFHGDEGYYSTLFHEMTHSTGHASRLNREGVVENHFFGDQLYSKEELVAEFGASYLCGLAGIENITVDNSASYIKGWLEAIQDDPKALVHASAKAMRAVDHILGIKYEDKGGSK